ncbi:Nif3-like dinuclear metal center hexameric protein [Paenibacillus aquistagni]|uniref:GTP cyclohydrolase 1 type 2 homolog n=1 Tax=Paenibacillus aquistagni TaxID=1852522 RepID=A0A1X7IY30_9BACL|nr:Nif3-like dinuclear metal center hexameric protein [Paenibacillus aquistagni]NMM52893.1 Nif3-like dinuclear metal center hexameric protein [Paenibacillus aquistagni]SMG20102.1 Putative GTP cyclohydrolase 1 type 2, NIF3 family [Paenibacillus aquistagni]
MNEYQLCAAISELFGDLLDQFKDAGEYGFNHRTGRTIQRLGYCTNLTPELIEQAKDKQVDFIITHHDAWEFIFGMKEECLKRLQNYRIGHFYVHLPLDYAEFGTCNSLFKEIGNVAIIKQSQHVNGTSTIGIGELTSSISFDDFTARVADVLHEDIKAWPYGQSMVKRIGMITGAGSNTNEIRSAKEQHCDVYMTGEKSLYTIQYAKFAGINLLVGSHTFTEIFGVRSFAQKLQAAYPSIELVYLAEEHFE